MNRERVLALASRIETEAERPTIDVGFNMICYLSPMTPFDEIEGFDDQSGHNCGTTACIAGWAVLQEHMENGWPVPETGSNSLCINFNTDARSWLDLSRSEADELFNCAPSGVAFHSVTPAMAVRTLRHLAETGRVDWTEANR